MIKFDQSVFKDMPKCFRWAARDRDGQIYLYDIRPHLLPSGWCDDVGGECSMFLGIGEKGGYWAGDVILRLRNEHT